MHILVTYIVWSYVVGLILFLVENLRALYNEKDMLLSFGIVILLLSPLTAWHGVLHYAALVWCKVTKQPFKPWI